MFFQGGGNSQYHEPQTPETINQSWSVENPHTPDGKWMDSIEPLLVVRLLVPGRVELGELDQAPVTEHLQQLILCACNARNGFRG